MPLLMRMFLANFEPVTITDIQPVIEAVTAQVTVSTVVTVIAWVLGLGVGFFFMWWGARKGLGMLKKAATRGKMSV